MRKNYPRDITREQFPMKMESVYWTGYCVNWWNRNEKNSRNPKTTMLIVDSKSIQNADTAEEKGYEQ